MPGFLPRVVLRTWQYKDTPSKNNERSQIKHNALSLKSSQSCWDNQELRGEEAGEKGTQERWAYFFDLFFALGDLLVSWYWVKG